MVTLSVPWRGALSWMAVTSLAACAGGPPATGPTPEQVTASARAAIAAEKMVDVATLPAGAVAIPPLSISASDTSIAPLAYGLADLLATDLARSARLTVVERVRLDAVLRELSLASSGAVDPGSAPRLGRIVGARRLVIGGLSELPGGELQISAQVADVATGGTQTALVAHAPLSRIFDAETALAFQIFNALGVTLTPAERAAVEAVPTRNVAALLAYSRGVRDESFGRYGAAAQQYRDALQADPAFTNARARMTGAEFRGGSGTQTSRRNTAGGANRAAQVASAGVNPSYADVLAGGAAAAVALGTLPSLVAVQRGALTTVTIFLQPVP